MIVSKSPIHSVDWRTFKDTQFLIIFLSFFLEIRKWKCQNMTKAFKRGIDQNSWTSASENPGK